MSEERVEKAAAWDLEAGHRPGKRVNTQPDKPSNEPDSNHPENDQVAKEDHELPESASHTDEEDDDPWGKWKNKSGR